MSVLVVLVATCLITVEVPPALGPWPNLVPPVRGMRLVSQGEYTLAVRDLARVVALRPYDAHAHYYLGLACGKIGLPEASLNHLQEAVRLDPADARFHDALGCAFRSVGAVGDAVVEFKEAVRHGPTTPRYAVDLAGLLMDQGCWDEAAALLRPVESGELASPGVRLLLAKALKHSGNPAGMEHECRAVIRLTDGTALGELARQDLRANAPGPGHEPKLATGASRWTIAMSKHKGGLSS